MVTKFLQIPGRILAHFSLQILSKSLRLVDSHWAPCIFCSLLRFSKRLRSRDWPGYFITLMDFFLSHSFVASAVCFGSLSCWNTHPRPIFSVLAEARTFSLKISLYLALSIFPSTRCSCPVPLAEKHPQNIMFPTPCLMVWMVFLESKSVFFSSKHELSWCQKAQF